MSDTHRTAPTRFIEIEGLEIWQDQAPDVVILDMDRAGGESLDALRQFRTSKR